MPLALPPSIVDFTSDIERIGPLLNELVTGVASIQPENTPDDNIQHILAYVNKQTDIDFRPYKRSSLLRRIQRRMTTLHINTLDSYAEYLKSSPEETTQLVNSLLINVTEFFRDPGAFAYLKSDILPRLIAQAREEDRVLRFWSAGCATGEEAYSIAMLVADLLAQELEDWNIKIFATDLDVQAITFARRGLFAEPLLKNVSADYRNRFFERTDGGYRISRQLRQMVTFGHQDLSRSGPFPHINLVLCRNVLIYFSVELQNLVLNNFTFALRPNGYLFLGKSETVRPEQLGYELVNKTWKIYQCTGLEVALPHRLNLIIRSRAPSTRQNTSMTVPAVRDQPSEDNRVAIVELSELRRFNEVLLRFLPMGVVVIDRYYHLLAANSTVRHLLGINEGGETADFLHAVRGIPYDVVRAAIDRAFREKTTVSLPEMELSPDMGGTGQFVSMTISIMQTELTTPELVAISVANITDAVRTRRHLEAAQTEQARLLNELNAVNNELRDRNRELLDTNDELHTSNEELVLTQEELQATIEEFETTNEELQAANEEMETTNEETQAINEELQTTNHELRARTVELQETANALQQEQEQLRIVSRQLLDSQEREKRALARELHDELGQELTALGLLLEASKQNPSSETDQQLEQARTLVGEMLRQVRQIPLDLRPSMLDDLGVVPALRWYCENYTSQTGIQVNFVPNDLDQRFPSDVETAAYRITQEALTNVARHSGAKTVLVEVWVEAQALYLRIKDGGKGFDLAGTQAAVHSTGIASMRERARLLGGELKITTAPGVGTEITVRLPVPDA